MGDEMEPPIRGCDGRSTSTDAAFRLDSEVFTAAPVRDRSTCVLPTTAPPPPAATGLLADGSDVVDAADADSAEGAREPEAPSSPCGGSAAEDCCCCCCCCKADLGDRTDSAVSKDLDS